MYPSSQQVTCPPTTELENKAKHYQQAYVMQWPLLMGPGGRRQLVMAQTSGGCGDTIWSDLCKTASGKTLTVYLPSLS